MKSYYLSHKVDKPNINDIEKIVNCWSGRKLFAAGRIAVNDLEEADKNRFKQEENVELIFEIKAEDTFDAEIVLANIEDDIAVGQFLRKKAQVALVNTLQALLSKPISSLR